MKNRNVRASLIMLSPLANFADLVSAPKDHYGRIGSQRFGQPPEPFHAIFKAYNIAINTGVLSLLSLMHCFIVVVLPLDEQ